MKKIIICLLLLIPGLVNATNPSLYSKQLRWGVFAYGGSRLWDRTAQGSLFRDWTADRYVYIFGGNDDKPLVDSIRARNTNIIMAKYELHLRQISDTQAIRQWCDTTPGCSFSSLLYHTGPGSADSVRIQVNATGGGFGSLFESTAGGSKPVIMPGFSGQRRVFWNERQYQYMGAWLGYKLSQEVLSIGCNAAFMDEFSHVKRTGANESGLWVNAYPLRGNDANYYQYGDWQTSFYPNWNLSLTHTQIRDSVSKLLIKVMDIVGDSFQAHGIIGFPNGASDWGPYTSDANWYQEGDTTSQVLGGANPGEYCYYYPGYVEGTANAKGPFCRELVWAAYNYKDIGGHFVVMQGGVGNDFSSLMSISRSQMLNLALHLDILFPGATTYGYSIHNQPYANLYFDYDDRLNSLTGHVADTIADWCYAFGKYFGVPKLTRDSTITGIDLAGQAYRLRKIMLGQPVDTSLIQTLVMVRYAENGSTQDSAATRSVQTLPTSPNANNKWYELKSNGTFIQTNVKISGDTVHVGNAQARIFISDSAMANAGFASTDTTIAIVTTASGVEGNSGSSTINVRVNMTNGPRSVSTTFLASTANVTATAGVDYTAISAQTFTITGGNTFVDIPVTISGDATVEPNETFTVTISSPSSPVFITNAIATVTITNDDSPPTAAGVPYKRKGKTIYKGKTVTRGLP